MGLKDHFNVWKAKLGGKAEDAQEARRRLAVERATTLEKAGRIDEAVSVLVEAEDPHRAAQTALRGRLYDRAGSIYESLNRPNDAARIYEQGQLWNKAAGCHERAGDASAAERCFKRADRSSLLDFYERREMWLQAAPLLEADGNHDAAGVAFGKAGDLDAAERCLAAAGKPLLVAEIFDRAGRPERAAPWYEKAGLSSKAADAYSAANNHREAARLLGQLARLAGVGGRSAPQKSIEDARTLARRAGEHAQAAGELREAADWFERAGDPARAGECLSSSDPATAAKLFEKAGDVERAAAAYAATGDAATAEILRTRDRDPKRSAELLAKHGKPLEAAELLLKAGHNREAAPHFRAAGRPQMAGELYLGLKDLQAAGECFEEAGLTGRAEPLYRQTGNHEGLLRIMTRRGDLKGAARIHILRRNLDAAITALQQLPPDAEADGLLAHCFRSKGMNDEARLKYEEAVRDAEVSRDNVGIFYEYGKLLEGEGRTPRALEIYHAILSVNLDYGDVQARIERLKAQPSAQAAPSAPDRYEIIRKLDEGGEGTVYLAKDTLLQRQVALKRIPATAHAGILGEARRIAGLSHPNIVAIYEVLHHGDGVYLVLEHLDGESLRDRIRRTAPLPPSDVVWIGRAICSALDYAHQQKLIHRDIKPANVMLTAGDEVKVLDFGLAKSVENPEVSSTLCGTPMYMAPEQILCRVPDARTDIYGVGATLYHTLAGRPPFEGEDLFYQHLHCLPPPIRASAPDVPVALDVLILKCLEKHPENRPGSAAELAEALREASGS